MKLATGVLILAVLVAACGGGGDSDLSEEEQAFADLIAAQMVDDPDDVATEAEAQCYGEAVVADMGLDRLVAVGLDQAAIESGTGPDDVELADEDVDALVDSMMECVDFGAFFTASLVEGGEGGVSEESAGCIADGISDESIEAAARAGIEGDELDDSLEQAFLSEMLDLMSQCLTPEELQSVAGG